MIKYYYADDCTFVSISLTKDPSKRKCPSKKIFLYFFSTTIDFTLGRKRDNTTLNSRSMEVSGRHHIRKYIPGMLRKMIHHTFKTKKKKQTYCISIQCSYLA